MWCTSFILLSIKIQKIMLDLDDQIIKRSFKFYLKNFEIFGNTLVVRIDF